MNSAQARNCYQQSEAQAEIHPVKLIHLMYERVLAHLMMTSDGVENDDPKLRGENLGKAIAIVAELNASIKEDDNSEPAHFLRGLYGAILQELPKVAVNNDKQILDMATGYIVKLKEIWEQTAMREAGFTETGDVISEKKPRFMPHECAVNNQGDKKQSVAGLSVSI